MVSGQNKADVASRHIIPGAAWIEKGKGGLPLVSVHTEDADFSMYLYGAHIAQFAPRGYADLLWMSPHSEYREGIPLRGGIPLIFPWFGPHRTRADLPMHGFVRTRIWHLETAVRMRDGKIMLVLSLTDDEITRELWPYPFKLKMEIIIGRELDVALILANTGTEPFVYENGFHTYLNVGHPRHCKIDEMAGLAYIDRLAQDRKAIQKGPAIFDGEMVRAFMHSPQKCTLADMALKRRIRITQSGLDATVLWNPGPDAGARNPEIQEGWERFVCVESTNCLECARAIGPGEFHVGNMKLSVEPLKED